MDQNCAQSVMLERAGNSVQKSVGAREYECSERAGALPAPSSFDRWAKNGEILCVLRVWDCEKFSVR